MPHSIPSLAAWRGACKSYGKMPAVVDLDLKMRGGEVLALLGENGAGKTTAIHLMLGLIEPDAGEVRLLDLPPSSLAARRGIGVMLQSAALPETSTVRELLQLTRGYYPAPRSVDDCVRIAGLEGLMSRRYGRLSGGQQRRVQFALAICGAPRVLFLDEPTTGLDIASRQQLWAAIHQLRSDGCAVLLTTHYLEEADALADRVAVMQGGRVLAEGDVDEIRARVDQRRIRCRSVLAEDVVATWAGVVSTQRDGECLSLVVREPESVLRRLLQEDATLADVEVSRAGLGEAFLALTRDSSGSVLEKAA